MTRISKLKETAFTGSGYDGYLLFGSANMLYFLGFPGTAALLVPADGQGTVFVYGVNFEQAKACGKGFSVEKVRVDEDLMSKIASQAADFKIKKLAIDGLSVEGWRSASRAFKGKAKIKIDNSYVAKMRMTKDRYEIECMRRAGEITSRGMKAAIDSVKAGVREYEVAAEIEYSMRKLGAGPTAFESIVATGACSAFPHGGCSDKIISEGDLVVVDIGATYNHYCSDMTRTLVAGKASDKQKKIYETVKTAQEEAFRSIKPGVIVRDLDAIARKVITEAGFGEFFVHRLGHGVGLEVHEPPSMGAGNSDKLGAGFVVTDEPGIYIPSFGGVRIEDTVLVTSKGAEKLTAGPYSLAKD